MDQAPRAKLQKALANLGYGSRRALEKEIQQAKNQLEIIEAGSKELDLEYKDHPSYNYWKIIYLKQIFQMQIESCSRNSIRCCGIKAVMLFSDFFHITINFRC